MFSDRTVSRVRRPCRDVPIRYVDGDPDDNWRLSGAPPRDTWGGGGDMAKLRQLLYHLDGRLVLARMALARIVDAALVAIPAGSPARVAIHVQGGWIVFVTSVEGVRPCAWRLLSYRPLFSGDHLTEEARP